MDTKDLPNFDGKVVVLYLANAPRALENGIVLESPSFVTQGDHLLLVGPIREPPDDPAAWNAGLEAGIVWESVCYYIVFDSIEDFTKRMGKVKRPFFKRRRDSV